MSSGVSESAPTKQTSILRSPCPIIQPQRPPPAGKDQPPSSSGVQRIADTQETWSPSSSSRVPHRYPLLQDLPRCALSTANNTTPAAALLIHRDLRIHQCRRTALDRPQLISPRSPRGPSTNASLPVFILVARTSPSPTNRTLHQTFTTLESRLHNPLHRPAVAIATHAARYEGTRPLATPLHPRPLLTRDPVPTLHERRERQPAAPHLHSAQRRHRHCAAQEGESRLPARYPAAHAAGTSHR